MTGVKARRGQVSHSGKTLVVENQGGNMPEARQGWMHFPHGADVGIAGYGDTVEEAFAAAADAMTAIVTDRAVNTQRKVEIHCTAPDLELLLVEWLNAVVYEMAEKRMLFGRFDIGISATQLHGTAWGEPLDRERHQPAAEVKGATYTALEVTRAEDGRWRAACVVDV